VNFQIKIEALFNLSTLFDMFPVNKLDLFVLMANKTLKNYPTTLN